MNISLFNFHIFKREITSVKELRPEVPLTATGVFGLAGIAELNGASMGHWMFFDQPNWRKLATESIKIGFHYLVNNNSINLTKVHFRNIYLGGLIKRDSHYFRLETTGKKADDHFHAEILEIIDSVNRYSSKRFPLIKIMNDLIRRGLTRNKINYPEKEFVVKLLRFYSNGKKWLKLVDQKNFLKIVTSHTVEIESGKAMELKKEYDFLIKDLNDRCLADPDYKLFVKTVKQLIKAEFESRTDSPSDGD